jgi:hypothetical protein
MAATGEVDRNSGRVVMGLSLSLLSVCALSGCADTRSAAVASDPVASIRPSGLSPRPAALAVTQMEGAPAPLQSQFMALFNADIAQRDVALTDQASARYLARGYLSAFPVDGGARLTYVWDIYDRTAHRAQRLNDEVALKGAAPDPWSMVDAAALTALAARSAGELAAYLSNTPEAMAQSAPSAPETQAASAVKVVAPTPDAAALPPQALSYSGTH